jgi:histidine triad (HIT) family protein
MDCIFCKIVNGDIPSYTIYEDDLVKVFLDVNPNSNGHSLIVPKKHIKDIYELDSEIYAYIGKVIILTTNLLRDKLHCQGFHVSNNIGSAQDVKHFHVHVIPVYDESRKKDINEVFDIITN